MSEKNLIDERAEKLKNTVYKKAYEKYGAELPPEIAERLKWELKMICGCENSILKLLLSAELCGAAMSEGYTVGTRGAAASSFAAYLLGITEINPLDAHYYCPKCRTVEFCENFFCGADMPKKKCAKCGGELIRDGYSIPPETLFGYGWVKQADIVLNFATEYLEKAKEHYKKLCGEWGISLEGDAEENTFVRFIERDMLGHDMHTVLKKLQDITGVKAMDIPQGDKKTMQIFKDLNLCGIEEFSNGYVKDCIFPMVKDISFDALIRISAISHGTGTWYGNADELFKEGVKFSDVVSCRDDVFLYLLKLGSERGEAFKISDRIRKGKGLDEEQFEKLKRRGVEEWRLLSWNKIKYVFPRAHAASYTLFSYKLAYYKAHFPLEFLHASLFENTDTENSILKFINSKAIREHCENIGHEFSELEKAYLINQSRNHTVEEKCAAWQVLLDSTGDFKLPSREDRGYDKLCFHELLNALIDYNKSVSEKFHEKGEKAVYQYSLKWNNWGKEEDGVHSDFEKCRTEAYEDYGHEFEYKEIRDFCIRKKYIDGGEITLFFNSEQNGYDFHITGMNFLEKEKEICDYLKRFWFYVPMPFKKGDILYDPDWDEEYVLKELYTDNKKLFSHWQESGDDTDMYATCFLVDDNGNLGSDQVSPCLNLEYCDEYRIQDNKRILMLLGSYLKDSGDIPEDLLLSGYIRHLKENELNGLKIYSAYDWLRGKGLTE